MVVKVYISGMSGNKEVKKRQQRVLMILDSKSIKYEIIDITEPGKESEKEMMQEKSKHKGETVGDPNPRHALPPQLFYDDEYCGDYDEFDLANEIDKLEIFLKMAPEEIESISTAQIELSTSKKENGDADENKENDSENKEDVDDVWGNDNDEGATKKRVEETAEEVIDETKEETKEESNEESNVETKDESNEETKEESKDDADIWGNEDNEETKKSANNEESVVEEPTDDKSDGSENEDAEDKKEDESKETESHDNEESNQDDAKSEDQHSTNDEDEKPPSNKDADDGQDSEEDEDEEPKSTNGHTDEETALTESEKLIQSEQDTA